MEQAETNGCDEADFRNGGGMAVESAELMQEEVRKNTEFHFFCGNRQTYCVNLRRQPRGDASSYGYYIGRLWFLSLFPRSFRLIT